MGVATSRLSYVFSANLRLRLCSGLPQPGPLRRPNRVTEVMEAVRGRLFAQQRVGLEAHFDLEFAREHRLAAHEARFAAAAVGPDLDDRAARDEPEPDVPPRLGPQLADVAGEAAGRLVPLRRRVRFHADNRSARRMPEAIRLSPVDCRLSTVACGPKSRGRYGQPPLTLQASGLRPQASGLR